MNQNFFWNDWHGFYRFFYKCLLVLFVLAGVLFGIAYYIGPAISIGWEVSNSIERLVIPLYNFDIHLFSIDIFGDNFLIFQEYVGGLLNISAWSTYGLLILTACFLVIYLSITSALKRFWYFIFTAVAVVLILSLKFEQIILFDSNSNIGFVVALLFYLPLSYFFHAFSSSSTFKTRLLAFTIATLLLGVLIHFFSGVEKPFLHLGYYGIMTPITITALFIILTAQEFVYFFLWIITRSASAFSKNNTLHFTVISLVYLLNLILVWFKNTGVIDWNILYLDAYFLFPVAAIIGIWGYRKKSETLRGILNFEPWGGILYLVFGIISFSTLSYFFFNAQDPFIEAYEDLIIYSQFGLGLLFFVYIIANFYTLIDNNKKVYRIVYDPKRMPYVTANIAGIIGMIALFAKSGFLAYDQSKAGYYNGLGDLYSTTMDGFAAESFYQLGTLYSPQNHRSNYALASLHERRGNPEQAIFFYKRAVLKKPTPQAYINTSRIYNRNGLFFEALFNLQTGLKTFPNSGQIKNNLGLQYAKTSILDSALIYFSADMPGKTQEVVDANLIGTLAKNDLNNLFYGAQEDSVFSVYENSSNLGFKNNLLVNLNKSDLRLPYKKLILPKDSSFTPSDVSFLGNQLIHFKSNYDSAEMFKVEKFANDFNLGVQQEELIFSMIIRNYFGANVNHALRSLNDLRRGSFENREKFGLVLGKMLMDQGAYAYASEILSESGISNTVKRNLAISLSELGHYNDAKSVWEEVSSNDSLDHKARAMSYLLNLEELPDPSKMDDSFKFLVVKYADYSTQLEEIARSIEHEYLKPMAYLELYQKVEDTVDAKRIYELVAGNNPVEGFVSKKHLKVELERLLSQGNWDKLDEVLSGISSEDPVVRWPYSYYRAKLAEEYGDTVTAKNYYDLLARNVFYEKGIIAAVNFYQEKMSDEDRAYQLILEAAEIYPNSIPILKKYVELALLVGLDNYAGEILKNLEQLMNIGDFKNFEKEIEDLANQLGETEFY